MQRDLPPSLQRPAPYKLWMEEKITLACEAVKDEGYTYRRVELEFGVPKSTETESAEKPYLVLLVVLSGTEWTLKNRN